MRNPGGFFHAWDNVIDKCEKKMWLLINGNNVGPNKPGKPQHFAYQGNINVSSTFVGPVKPSCPPPSLPLLFGRSNSSVNLLASIKRYPIWKVCGYCSEHLFA